MDNKLIPNIIFIILGILIIFFPMLGVLAINLVIAIPIFIIGLVILLMGLRDNNNLLKIILGILILIFAILLIVFPNLFALIISLLVTLIGVLLIIYAIVSIIRRSARLNVIVITLIIGIIYFAIGYLLRDPNVLGLLIGLSLLVGGFIGIIKEVKS